MSLAVVNITFDCAEPTAVAAFWSAALGRDLDEGASEYFVSMAPGAAAPGMFFIKVPEAKAVKNRVHLDLHSDDRTAEVERLLGLGATKVGDYDEHGHRWSTLRDPEGNEFCVAD